MLSERQSQVRQKIVIGTRSSKLALWQADYVADCLRKKYPGLIVEEKKMTTKGDKILDAPLAKIGGKGLFTKELEAEMLEGGIDLAVHSLKDMPTEVPDGLVITAITKRFDPGDAVVCPKYKTLDALPKGARVGTSSLRRRAQILAVRPDLELIDLRGNVNTRLKKLDDGEYDAIILAVAGLKRLGFGDRITEVLPKSMC
ncbi:MAG: hydroxymethylbilane synthase, partial [Schwartzia sp.]|nr:hydroxymethylbilane synthase [Schwartzia sp. (in: firmicutes)]